MGQKKEIKPVYCSNLSSEACLQFLFLRGVVQNRSHRLHLRHPLFQTCSRRDACTGVGDRTACKKVTHPPYRYQSTFSHHSDRPIYPRSALSPSCYPKHKDCNNAPYASPLGAQSSYPYNAPDEPIDFITPYFFYQGLAKTEKTIQKRYTALFDKIDTGQYNRRNTPFD